MSKLSTRRTLNEVAVILFQRILHSSIWSSLLLSTPRFISIVLWRVHRILMTHTLVQLPHRWRGPCRALRRLFWSPHEPLFRMTSALPGRQMITSSPPPSTYCISARAPSTSRPWHWPLRVILLHHHYPPISRVVMFVYGFQLDLRPHPEVIIVKEG